MKAKLAKEKNESQSFGLIWAMVCLVGLAPIVWFGGCDAGTVVAENSSPAVQQEGESANADDKKPDALSDEEEGFLKGATDLLDKVQDKLGDAAESGSNTAEDTMEWAGEMFKSLKDQGLTTANSTKEWVQSDWNRMGAWEYKVVQLSDSPAEKIEKELNGLGDDRWECFHVSKLEENGPIMMYFKKPAKSYLKHVPLKDMMKLIPMMDSGEE